MRKFAKTAPLCVLLVCCTACGLVTSSVDADKSIEVRKHGTIKVGAVAPATGPTYWTMVERGARCAATRSAEVEFQWNSVRAPTDVREQADLLRDQIEVSDAIAYAPADPKSLAPVTEHAKSEGVAVSNFDTGTAPQPGGIPLFTTDNFVAAREAGRFVTGAPADVPTSGEVGVLDFQPGTEANKQRVAGFIAELGNDNRFHVVARRSSQDDVAIGRSGAQDMLRQHPNLSTIFATSRAATMGAAEAVQRAGKAGQVVVVGWGGAPEQIGAVQEGIVHGLVVQNPFRMGFDAVTAVIDRIREGKFSSDEDTRAMVVHQDNLGSPEVTDLLDPTCTHLPPGVRVDEDPGSDDAE